MLEARVDREHRDARSEEHAGRDAGTADLLIKAPLRRGPPGPPGAAPQYLPERQAVPQCTPEQRPSSNHPLQCTARTPSGHSPPSLRSARDRLAGSLQTLSVAVAHELIERVVARDWDRRAAARRPGLLARHSAVAVRVTSCEPLLRRLRVLLRPAPSPTPRPAQRRLPVRQRPGLPQAKDLAIIVNPRESIIGRLCFRLGRHRTI